MCFGKIHKQSHIGWIITINKTQAFTYSAITVLPADVWAETSTDWLLSTHKMDSFWKGSNVNGYVLAGSPLRGCKGTYGWPGGQATSCVQDSCVSMVWTNILFLNSAKLTPGVIKLESFLKDHCLTWCRWNRQGDLPWTV